MFVMSSNVRMFEPCLFNFFSFSCHSHASASICQINRPWDSTTRALQSSARASTPSRSALLFCVVFSIYYLALNVIVSCESFELKVLVKIASSLALPLSPFRVRFFFFLFLFFFFFPLLYRTQASAGRRWCARWRTRFPPSLARTRCVFQTAFTN